MESAIKIDIDLKDHEILKSLGYKKGKKPSQETIHVLHEILCRLSDKFLSLGTYRIFDYFQAKNKELLTPYGCIKSAQISSLSGKAESILIGLVTVHNLKKTKEDDLLYDYLLHGIGTVAVEKAVDSLLMAIEEKTRRYASLPFSPGYCDWDINGQEFIFNALDPSIINVKMIPESFRMLPIYTISFVSLLGLQKMDRNPCSYCNLKKCSMRRT